MNRIDDLKDLKRLVGLFYEEIKSNSVTDLIIWLDCKLEYQTKYENEMRNYKKKYS